MLRHKRLRGRKAVEVRRRGLWDEPLCRKCSEQGKVTVAVTRDHIVPLSKGGTNDPGNMQSLCADCDRDKTNQDMGYRTKPYIAANGLPVGYQDR